MAKYSLNIQPKSYALSLVLLVLICFGSWQSVYAASRDIFKKPAATKVTTAAIKKPTASTTAQVEAGHLKELMNILNQNATVTYPVIEEIGQLKQAESKANLSLNATPTLFNKTLPYLLGLIVLLILVIIIFLWRWLRQKSKLFFDQHQQNTSVKAAPTITPIKTIERIKTPIKPISQEVIKKTVSPEQSVNRVKLKNNLPGVLNLKDLGRQPKSRTKRI